MNTRVRPSTGFCVPVQILIKVVNVPKRGKGNIVVVTFKASPDFIQKIDIYAVNHNMHRSEVIRMALEEFLATHKNNNTNISTRVEKGRRIW